MLIPSDVPMSQHITDLIEKTEVIKELCFDSLSSSLPSPVSAEFDKKGILVDSLLTRT